MQADLRPPTREERAPPGQIRVGVATGPVVGGAGRAQLVIERIDGRVALLAGVAGARPGQCPGRRAGGPRGQLPAAGLVVDATRCTRRGGGGDSGVVRQLRGAPVLSAPRLDLLEHPAGGSADGGRVRVVDG